MSFMLSPRLLLGIDALLCTAESLLHRVFNIAHSYCAAPTTYPASVDERPTFELARYSDMKQWAASILDTYIPACRRLTQLHFGRIVSNPDAPQAFAETMGYNMTYNLVEPFKGNALHIHPSVEVFIALDGRWEIAWGEAGKQTTVLQPFDLVCVPADVRHSYKSIEPHTAHNIMTILPGKASITWAPAVVAEARKHGARCTDDGVLLDFWSKAHAKANQAAEEAEHAATPPRTAEEQAGPGGAPSGDAITKPPPKVEPDYHLPMSDEEMSRCVRRHADGSPLVVRTPDGFLRVSWRTLAAGEAFDASHGSGSLHSAGSSDLLLVVLEGTAELTCAGTLRGIASRLDAVRIPATKGAKSQKSAAVIALANRLPDPCTLLVVESQMRGLVDTHCDSWLIGGDDLLPPTLNGDVAAASSRAHASLTSVMGLLQLIR